MFIKYTKIDDNDCFEVGRRAHNALQPARRTRGNIPIDVRHVIVNLICCATLIVDERPLARAKFLKHQNERHMPHSIQHSDQNMIEKPLTRLLTHRPPPRDHHEFCCGHGLLRNTPSSTLQTVFRGTNCPHFLY